MEILDNIVIQSTTPEQTNVMWVDVSGPSKISLKVFNNGEWTEAPTNVKEGVALVDFDINSEQFDELYGNEKPAYVVLNDEQTTLYSIQKYSTHYMDPVTRESGEALSIYFLEGNNIVSYSYQKPDGSTIVTKEKEASVHLLSPRDIDTYIDKTSLDSRVPSSKAAYKAVHPKVGTSIPYYGMYPNIQYNLGTITAETKRFSLATPEDSTITNHYFFTFSTGETAPTITWDSKITSWKGGNAPTINANKYYEISVLDGVGICLEI